MVFWDFRAVSLGIDMRLKKVTDTVSLAILHCTVTCVSCERIFSGLLCFPWVFSFHTFKQILLSQTNTTNYLLEVIGKRNIPWKLKSVFPPSLFWASCYYFGQPYNDLWKSWPNNCFLIPTFLNQPAYAKWQYQKAELLLKFNKKKI